VHVYACSPLIRSKSKLNQPQIFAGILNGNVRGSRPTILAAAAVARQRLLCSPPITPSQRFPKRELQPGTPLSLRTLFPLQLNSASRIIAFIKSLDSCLSVPLKRPLILAKFDTNGVGNCGRPGSGGALGGETPGPMRVGTATGVIRPEGYCMRTCRDAVSDDTPISSMYRAVSIISEYGL
jgi:hypothetical protein